MHSGEPAKEENGRGQGLDRKLFMSVGQQAIDAVSPLTCLYANAVMGVAGDRWFRTVSLPTHGFETVCPEGRCADRTAVALLQAGADSVYLREGRWRRKTILL